MANNLNQLARQANKEGYSRHRDANIALAREIYDIIKLFAGDSKDNEG